MKKDKFDEFVDEILTHDEIVESSELPNELFENKELDKTKKEKEEPLNYIDENEVAVIDSNILKITSFPGYPSYFPSSSELQREKNQYGNLYYVILGGLVDTIHQVPIEQFILRRFQSHDLAKYLSLGYDVKDVINFQGFLIETCVVFPKLTKKDVFQLGIGTKSWLNSKIRLYSRIDMTTKNVVII